MTIIKINEPYGYATHGVTSRVELYTVNVQIVGNGLTTKSIGKNIVKKGDSFTITALPAEGHGFVKWIEPDDENSTITVENITEDINLTAMFRKLRIFNYEIIGEGAVEFTPNIENGQSVTDRTVIKALAEPSYGYMFDRFSLNRQKDYLNSNKLSFAVDSDMMLFVRFKKIIHTITNYCVGNGVLNIVDHNEMKLNHGDLITFEAIPGDGWEFHMWKYDFNDVDSNIIEDHMLVSDLKVVPVFREI